jgi:Ca2+-binding RTX toxin-like protein
VKLNAEIFQYGENSDQYIALVHNEKLGQWFFDFGASDDNVYFGGERSFVLGGSGSDRLLGGWGSDYLVAGSSGSDSETLMGYSGDDILIVGDYVTRSNTTFYLDGGDGDDVLILGNSSGIVVGGDSSDRFVVNPIIESDVNFNLVIQDFDYFTDKLVFSVPGLNDIQSGIFVNYSDSSVIFDITSILRSSAQDFWAENPLAQSILKLENLELSGVTVESILDTWIEFDTSSYSTTWTDLSSGWITYA